MTPIATIIVAGGSGARMGADRPKQYLDLAGRPILCRTAETLAGFLSPSDHMILVVPESDLAYVRQMLDNHGSIAPVLHVVAGGATRAHSVQNGLREVPEGVQTIAVHDGVRPFVTPELWQRLLSARAIGHAAVIPAFHPVESVRIMEGERCVAFPRDKVYLVQTPQLFDRQTLVESYWRYMLDPHDGLTDDAGILTEYMGIEPDVVEGVGENIKITTPPDLALARWILAQKEAPSDHIL